MSRTVDDDARHAATAASSERSVNVVFLTARRHVDYGRVRSAMCPAI
jgi:hypothetical protein